MNEKTETTNYKSIQRKIERLFKKRDATNPEAVKEELTRLIILKNSMVGPAELSMRS